MKRENPYYGSLGITRIVNRCHVADEPETVETYYISRLDQKAWQAKSDRDRKLILEAVRRHHAENRQLYSQVTRGSIGG